MQEEEELWISSEELCTEGSSDEESKPRNKISKVRQSKRAHWEQLKIEREKQKEKLTLPPINLPEGAQCSSFDYSKACGSNYYTKRKSLEESIRKSHEIDKLWRPKRGSITLPVGPDGRFTKTETDL